MRLQHVLVSGVSAATFVLAVGAPAAWSAVTFNRDTVIASAGNVADGNVKINVRSDGTVDLAWRGTGDNSRINYTEVGTNGQILVDGTNINTSSYVLGIGRTSGGVVKVGTMWKTTMYQFTRQTGGNFTSSTTGLTAGYSSAQNGQYDVSPTTGLGGFVYLDVNNKVSYVHQTASNTWDTTVLASPGDTSGRNTSFAYGPTGQAVTAYNSGSQFYAGTIGGTISNLKTANTGYPMAVTVDTSGKIHVLQSWWSGATMYYSSADGGQTWSSHVLSGQGFSDKGTAIAVAPDGTLAALIYDSNSNLQLTESTDGGVTWTAQALAGGGSQLVTDLGFDANNNLYVAYYDGTNDKLHLLSTAPVPEPGTLGLLTVGGLLCLRRKRRA